MEKSIASNYYDNINEIRSVISSVLDSLVKGDSECALLDLPQHSNVGDSAIFLGELEYLAKRNCKIRYVCDCYNYNESALSSLIGNNIIFLHGGGNFGDIWPIHQEFREKIVNDFPNNRIVLFPQSIHFSDENLLEKSKSVFSKHKDFHIIVRDKVSYSLAKKYYNNPVYLCPDLALMLDLDRSIYAKSYYDYVVLSRTDKEKFHDFNIKNLKEGDCKLTDWVDESEPKYLWLYNWCHKRLAWNSKVPIKLLGLISVYSARKMAFERLERGLNILGQGKKVVTDRLHAVILSFLIKIPVEYVDNNYNKLSNFMDTWFSGFEDIKKSATYSDALKISNE